MQSFLIHLLVTYKYALLVPIGFFEGHIVSLLSGFLSRQGLLNPFFAAACIALGNLIGDVGLYWLGRAKGERFIKKYERRFGVTDEKLAKAKEIYHSHKSTILLFSKLTNGFGFAIVILLTAGMMRIKFSTYMLWNVMGECIWTGGLVAIGYFFGSLYQQTGSIISKVGIISFSTACIVFAFMFFKKRMQANINL